MQREIYVFDNGGITADRYTVVIDLSLDNRPDFHCWHMSDDAAMPNGVCMYSGVLTESELADLFDDVCKEQSWIVRRYKWPKQVRQQIDNILEASV